MKILRNLPAARLLLLGGLALVPFASGADPVRPAASAGGMLQPRGAVSADDENEGGEADPKFRPDIRRFQPRAASGASGTRARGSAATSARSGPAHLKDHPKGQELVRQLEQLYQAREINVSLLNGHKYMINDCLGLKVSAGEFKLKFINPSVRIDGSGIVFECGISRIDMSAIKLRMRPRVPPWDDPNPCKFSKKFEVGGSAEDIRIIMRFDPLLDLERCRVADVTSVDIRVRIGELNLKPLQNDLDRMAKDMVEDALTYFLNVNFLSQVVQTLDDLIEADCPGNPGNAGRSLRNTADKLGVTSGSGGAATKGTAESGGAPVAGASSPSPSGGARSTPPASAPASGAGPDSAAGASSPAEPATGSAVPGAPGAEPAEAARLRELEQRVAELERRLAAAPVTGPETPASAAPAEATKPGPSSRVASPGSPASRAGGAFEVAANPELKGRLGRLVVVFPAAGNLEINAYTGVHRPGSKDRIEGFYKSGQLELMPGNYDVYVSGHLIRNVPIQSRHDTRIHVGVLKLNGSSSTYFGIHEVGAPERFDGHYGTKAVGLPVGEFEVVVRDDREKVVIGRDQVTEF